MSSKDDFLDKKKLKKLDNQLNEIISRVGLDRKTQDEVFDKKTLHTIEKFISDRIIDIIDFPISTGKEGNVFRAVTLKKKLVAVKIYRINTATFKHISSYIIGDPRFKTIRNTKKDIIYAWTKKEYKNLQILKKLGIRAPVPIKFQNNVLIMEYIGLKNKPAQLLKDTQISDPEYIFKTLINNISTMYKKADLVHADLSAFNILIHKNEPVLIDLGQGVLLDHPQSDIFLRRDITNIVNYFKKYKIKSDEKKIYYKITKKSW